MGIRKCHCWHETNTFKRNHQLYSCLEWQPALLTPGQSKQMNVVWAAAKSIHGKSPLFIGVPSSGITFHPFYLPYSSWTPQKIAVRSNAHLEARLFSLFLSCSGSFRKPSITLSIIGFLRERHPSFDSSETINFKKFIAQSIFITVIYKFLKI